MTFPCLLKTEAMIPYAWETGQMERGSAEGGGNVDAREGTDAWIHAFQLLIQTGER